MCGEWPGSFREQSHRVHVARPGRPCSRRSHPSDVPPGALGALAVGGLCLLACFYLTDFSSHCTGHGVLLMGGWVLAVRRESLGRIGKRSNLTGFTRPPQQAGWPPQNQPAGPRKLGLGPLVSLAPSPQRAFREVTENLAKRTALLP